MPSSFLFHNSCPQPLVLECPMEEYGFMVGFFFWLIGCGCGFLPFFNLFACCFVLFIFIFSFLSLFGFDLFLSFVFPYHFTVAPSSDTSHSNSTLSPTITIWSSSGWVIRIGGSEMKRSLLKEYPERQKTKNRFHCSALNRNNLWWCSLCWNLKFTMPDHIIN